MLHRDGKNGEALYIYLGIVTLESSHLIKINIIIIKGNCKTRERVNGNLKKNYQSYIIIDGKLILVIFWRAQERNISFKMY